jgi:hypothetical protein
MIYTNKIKRELIQDFFITLDKDEREDWVKQRKRCDASLYYFIKFMGEEVQQGEDLNQYIHKPLCDIAQDERIKRKAIFMPRKWRKSTAFTKWTNIKRYLDNNNVRILIPSENETIGSRFLLFMEKMIIRNRKLRWYYPELRFIDDTWVNKNRWSGTQCDLPKTNIHSEATLTVIGVGGAAQSGHYDYITPDDLVGKKAMESAVVMEGVFLWFDNVEELTVDESSVIQIVGTHWGLGDFGCYVQEKYPEYLWMIVPYLKDLKLKDKPNINWIQNPTVEDGESNFPEKFSTKDAIRMMNNPEKRLVFFTQHQNNPTQSEEFNKIDLDWIKYYHFENKDKGSYVVCDDGSEDLFQISAMPKYGIIDPGGFSEVRKKKGSNNAYMIGGQPVNSVKKFVLSTYAKKMKSTALFKEDVYADHRKWHPRFWRIETYGQQGGLYKDLRFVDPKETLAERMKPAGFYLSSCPADVSENAKANRILELIPAVENGEIYVHISMKKLISEMGNYPQVIGGIDLLDCLAWLFQIYWTRKKKADVRELNRKKKQQFYFARQGAGY